jgi:pilus assembly protein Flp/PilA
MLKLFVKSKLAIADLKKNIEGASLIEYSLLIGLITAAVIATIVLVANLVSGAWSGLYTNWSAGVNKA